MCLRLMSNFMQELETKAEFASLRGLVEWLRSYFWSSSPTLMRCMLYLSIFPRGQTFRWRRLVRRWIAEGYVRGVESNGLEELAGEIFKKLASQGVVQQATPATIEVWYEVSGFFHEFMISQSMEERSLFPLQVSVLDEGHRGVTTEGVGQHLAIMEKWERNKIVFDSLDFSRLRSLTVFGKWEPYFVSDKMRVLRVLDIQDSKGSLESSALDKMLQLLPRLKFLSLRASKNVTCLPESLGGLSQLQTLDIRHTDVVKLPASIIKLRKLQYIRSGTTLQWKHEEEPTPPRSLQSALSPFLPKFCKHGTPNDGVEVPRGMKSLTALQTLGVVNASAAGGKAILKELRKLSQLRKLAVSGINQENIKHLSLALVSDLESLYLHIQKGNTAASASVGEIQLPPKLQSLKLHGSVDNKLLPSIWKLTYLTKLGLEVEELPPSISELKGRITKLNLDLNASKREDIEVLGKLEKLHTLRLRIRKVQDDELRFCDGQDHANRFTPTLFLKLQILNIACTNRLHVRFGEGAMQKLVLLVVRCYQRPSLLQFSGLEHLVSLNQVSLGGQYDDTLVTALREQLEEHPKKPVLKKLEE